MRSNSRDRRRPRPEDRNTSGISFSTAERVQDRERFQEGKSLGVRMSEREAYWEKLKPERIYDQARAEVDAYHAEGSTYHAATEDIGGWALEHARSPETAARVAALQRLHMDEPQNPEDVAQCLYARVRGLNAAITDAELTLNEEPEL